MKIDEAIKTAATLLQSEEVIAYFASDSDAVDMSDECKSELELLLACCNLVLGELASSDFPLTARIKIDAADGRIEYSQIDARLLFVSEIKREGVRLPFREFTNRIEIPALGECEVTYSYAPEELKLGDDSPYGGEIPSARLIAYGIAREYCLINGMTQEASVWDSRYAAAATEEARGRRGKRVLARRWV